jgi:hypothetical protein
MTSFNDFVIDVASGGAAKTSSVSRSEDDHA